MPTVNMYARPEILARDKHAKLKFSPLANFSFARKLTSVPVVGVEFPHVCRRHPIGFLEDPQGGIHAQAILSLVENDNGFIDEQGRWLGTYVPSFIRRYPFILADVPNNPADFAVAFDADSGAFAEDKGQPLFEENGEPAELLKNQMEFLRRFHAENHRTVELLKALKTEGLLVPLNLDITRSADKARFGVRGLLMIDEKKLTALPADKAGTYLANGLLALSYMHLISLRNFESLANRIGHKTDDQIPWWAK